MPSHELKAEQIKAEYQVILRALEKHNFNQSKAAAELGIDRRTLYNKLKAYRDLTQQQVA